MSCVNMLLRARNCESSDIVAETMPTPRKPATNGLVSLRTMVASTAFISGEADATSINGLPPTKATVAQTPNRMQGPRPA